MTDLTPEQIAILALIAQVEALREAVGQARQWFDEYAAMHLAKGTAEGERKAARNAERAAYFRATLGETK